MDRPGGKPPGDHAFSGQIFLSPTKLGFKHLAATLAYGVELLVLVVVREPAGGEGIQQPDSMRHADLLQRGKDAVHRDGINVPAGLQHSFSHGRYREGLDTFVEGLQDQTAWHGDAQTPRFHAF